MGCHCTNEKVLQNCQACAVAYFHWNWSRYVVLTQVTARNIEFIIWLLNSPQNHDLNQHLNHYITDRCIEITDHLLRGSYRNWRLRKSPIDGEMTPPRASWDKFLHRHEKIIKGSRLRNTKKTSLNPRFEPLKHLNWEHQADNKFLFRLP